MSVEIDPQELSFQRPFTKEVSELLRIRNPNNQALAFKVKTTAPKQYCVRPNSGRIEPGQSVEVTVLLQAMKQEPAPDARCKDKFLVQAAIIRPELELEGGIPAVFEATERKDIVEKKIRVTWLAADDESPSGLVAQTPNRASVNGGDLTPDVSRVYDSPTAADADATVHAAVPSHDAASTKSEEAQPTVAEVVKEKVKLTYEQLEAEVARLQAEVANSKLATGLRQRVVSKDGEKPTEQLATVVREAAPQGVPLQIAALLCFLAFILGYAFF